MIKLFKLACFIAAFFGLTFQALGQGVDPLIGSWKFNPEKSTSFAFTFPKSQILTWGRWGKVKSDFIPI